MLYGIAQYNKKTRLYSIIPFSSKKELAARVKKSYKDKAFSYVTLTRMLKDPEYKEYFTVEENVITLNNNFSSYANPNKDPFVIISSIEANFLISQKDSLLAKYYCYLKYYCGLAANAKPKRKQDATAKQFLLSAGLSGANHNNLSKISHYNRLLEKEKMIKIEKYRDSFGNERNIYSIL